MTPPTVNAYYDPAMNNINFPAGILQPPFYDKDASDATSTTATSAPSSATSSPTASTIEGRKFDANGNLHDWWTPEDKKQFEERTGCLVNEYSQLHRRRRRQGQWQAHPRRKHRRQRRPAPRLHGADGPPRRFRNADLLPRRSRLRKNPFLRSSSSSSVMRKIGVPTNGRNFFACSPRSIPILPMPCACAVSL